MINSHAKKASDLSNLDKAAILLLSMGEESAAKIVSKLSREDVVKLSNHMAKLPGVLNEEAHQVIQTFFKEFSRHSGIAGAPRSFLENTLNQAIGKGMAQKMLDGIYGDSLREDFQKLQWVSPDLLAQSFKSQHITMQATLLAFLPQDTAAQVMWHLPKESHDTLLTKVAKMTDVSATVIEELKIAVEECIDYVSEQNTANVDGVKQAAEILNRYQGDRQAMLETMRMTDEKLAQSVTENMYDFTTLARQDENTLAAIIDAVEREQIAMALKGADPEILSAIMGAVTQRMGEALKEQMELIGSVPVSQVELARKEIMAQVRTMNEEEEIKYQIFEEQVVE